MMLSVLMPWRGPESNGYRWDSFRWLVARYAQIMPDAEFIAADSEPGMPFNRAQARNRAFTRSSGDVLLIADADTIFHLDTIVAAVNLVRAGIPWVIPYGSGRYYNLSRAETDLILRSKPHGRVPEPIHPSQWEHKLDSWAGLIVVSREAWYKVGGYDERFYGWGYEDNAFRFALDNRVGPHRRLQDGYALHLWHPVAADAGFENPAIAANRELCRLYESGELP